MADTPDEAAPPEPEIDSVRVPIVDKITVDHDADRLEYNRQYQWLMRHPEANVCPPTKKKDYLKKITVDSSDFNEYQRQRRWFKKHPNANVCPPKGTQRKTRQQFPGITVKQGEDPQEYQR